MLQAVLQHLSVPIPPYGRIADIFQDSDHILSGQLKISHLGKKQRTQCHCAAGILILYQPHAKKNTHFFLCKACWIAISRLSSVMSLVPTISKSRFETYFDPSSAMNRKMAVWNFMKFPHILTNASETDWARRCRASTIFFKMMTTASAVKCGDHPGRWY